MKLSRREFLRAASMAAAGLAAASCAQPTPQVIEKPFTVVVEKEVPVEKQVLTTVIVEKEVPVEKVVQQTVVVEREKVVKETVVVEREKQVEKVITATPVVMKYQEAPMLAGLVQSGQLPPVDERLPDEPMVVNTVEEIGQYGGTWHRLAVGPGDLQLLDRLTYEYIVRSNADGSEIVPNVARSWEVSPDGKMFTFSLRKGMKWSDGAPYTADDIVFYYETLLNKELTTSFPSWLRSGGDAIIEKVDDYTVRFVFPETSGLFMVMVRTSAARPITTTPKHFLEQFHSDYVEKAKLDAMVKEAGFEAWYQLYQSKTDARSNVDQPVIFAWKVTVPAPKQPIVAERNPYYWKVDTAGNQLPYIDRMEHMIVESAQLVNMRAMAGEVDMQLRHITFDNYPLFQENKDRGDYRVLEWTNGFCAENVIWFNQTHKDPVMREILSDKRFRQALSLGIDREEIIEGVYLGVGVPVQPSPLPTSPLYWEEQATYLTEFDPDRANALLDEMGLTDRDSDGYRLRSDGKRMGLVFEYAPIFGTWGPVGELLVEHWKRLGIELTVKEEARALLWERKAANEVDMTMWQGSGEFNPLINPIVFISYGNTFGGYQYWAWWNSGGASGEEPQGGFRKGLELYDQIKATADFDEQKRLFRQILEIWMDDPWTLAISTPAPGLVIVKNSFRNVPENAISDWNVLTPGATATEQYFIRS